MPGGINAEGQSSQRKQPGEGPEAKTSLEDLGRAMVLTFRCVRLGLFGEGLGSQAAMQTWTGRQ